MTKTQEVREEQVNFLKNHPDPSHVSFHEQLDDELVGEESSKTGLGFGKIDDSLVFPDGDSDEELT
ncbi:18739_t:CDS:2, partial [Gigaspora margarita]